MCQQKKQTLRIIAGERGKGKKGLSAGACCLGYQIAGDSRGDCLWNLQTHSRLGQPPGHSKQSGVVYILASSPKPWSGTKSRIPKGCNDWWRYREATSECVGAEVGLLHTEMLALNWYVTA